MPITAPHMEGGPGQGSTPPEGASPQAPSAPPLDIADQQVPGDAPLEPLQNTPAPMSGGGEGEDPTQPEVESLATPSEDNSLPQQESAIPQPGEEVLQPKDVSPQEGKNLSPLQKDLSPQQEDLSPQQEKVPPLPSLQEDLSPQQKDLSPDQKRDSTPLSEDASPQQEDSSPQQQKDISPQEAKNFFPPAEDFSPPEEKAPTPEEKSPTPEEKAPTPEEEASTPEEKAPTPEERAFTSPEEDVSPPKSKGIYPYLEDDILQEVGKDISTHPLEESPVTQVEKEPLLQCPDSTDDGPKSNGTPAPFVSENHPRFIDASTSTSDFLETLKSLARLEEGSSKVPLTTKVETCVIAVDKDDSEKQPMLGKMKKLYITKRLNKKKGIIEEGDGLYEERSTTSGSEDEQAKALLREGVIVAEMPSEEDETSQAILMQVMLPFLVAGLGMVGAGLVLDIVQHWDVFVVVSELFIMVPALLGLKGNLEMTLASRLSTHANMGHLDHRDECLSMILGNLALIQCQAIVVGFLASVAAVVMGWIPEGEFHILHALLLCASALVTASLASFILGVIMVGVILLSRKCNINPDNVATPIAASLGDLTTLGLLSWIASILYEAKTEDYWLAPLIIVGYLLSLPLWIWLASRNKHTKEVLYSGWTPVIAAMMISSMGGLILDFTVANYKGIAVYQPVINGVGGNLVAVQASRISTALHLMAPLGVMPKAISTICMNPCSAFCARSGHPRAARVLLLLVVPGHLVFVYAISYLKAGHTSLTPIFVVIYLLAAFLQVMILLYVAYVMVHWMWKVAIDPDNSAIPYLTALGDLLGTGLLAIAFHFLYVIGDGDADVGD